MIPRSVLFGNPRRAGLRISPDGRWLSWSAAVAGAMNLWVAPRHDLAAAEQYTFETVRDIAGHDWSMDSRFLIFALDNDGDENFRIHVASLAERTVRCVTPLSVGRAQIAHLSRRQASRVLVSINERDPMHADLFLVDLDSGERELVLENPGYAGFVVDDDYRPILAISARPDGGMDTLLRTQEGGWSPWMQIAPEDIRTTGVLHVSPDGGRVYFLDSRGRGTAVLAQTDLKTGVTGVVFEDARVDLGNFLWDIESGRPLAARVHYERPQWHVLDASIAADFERLDHLLPRGQWVVADMTADARLWLVSVSTDRSPGAAHLFDRVGQTLTWLYDYRPELEEYTLARMQPLVIPSRDGLPLVSYLTLPAAVDTGLPQSARHPVPLVVLVHGGPWERDYFGFNAEHQWLANRGWAVISVNFRGSTGFGKAFVNAGDGQWGAAMDDDLDDAVQYLIRHGIADPDRMAIMGGSYGGYAVLSALTRHPGRYCCGVDIVGPANLETLMASIPAYWESARSALYRAVGDPRTAEGRALLRQRSPLHAADRIRDALLIGQGANDPRVPLAEAEQMVGALRRHGIAYTYALFPDEGHGFHREPNRLIFNALAENFLARHLQGSAEPYDPSDFPGNTLRLTVGPEGRRVPDEAKEL